MKPVFFIIPSLLLGILLTLGFDFIINSQPINIEASKKTPEAVLYWVAPMDASYRRDAPGKSPMGMDLVPVYASTNTQDSNVITIEPHIESNIGIKVTPVIEAELKPVIHTVGYVSYDEDKLIHIHPRIHGWVENLYVKSEGDKVKRGDALYSLYSPELVNAQDEYLLALQSNNERLLRGASSRLKALRISDSFIKQLNKTRRVKQTVTFYSLQDGVIKNLNIRQGFYVEPATTLMSIANLDTVWINAEVFESQASFLQINQNATVSFDYLPDQKWTSTIDYIYPSISAKNRTLNVRIRLDNPQKIFKPNMFGQVDIDVSDDKKYLLVPKQAVIRTGQEDRIIIALGQGKFQVRQVNIGNADDNFYALTEGVNLGDNVVTSAQFLIDSESNKHVEYNRLDSTGKSRSQETSEHHTHSISDSHGDSQL